LLALAISVGFAIIWGIDPEKEVSLLAIGTIMVMGLSRIFTSAIDSKGSIALFVQASLLAIIVTVAFFTLEAGTGILLSSQVPALPVPGLGKIMITGIILLAFAGALFIQILAPVLSHNAFYLAVAIHLRNGFYLNAIFDRMVGALRIHSPESKRVAQLQMDQIEKRQYLELNRLEEQTA
jgi:NAD(P)H-quinone oxidoreductase subunit 5